jgi:hypothetical protein
MELKEGFTQYVISSVLNYHANMPKETIEMSSISIHEEDCHFPLT